MIGGGGGCGGVVFQNALVKSNSNRWVSSLVKRGLRCSLLNVTSNVTCSRRRQRVFKKIKSEIFSEAQNGKGLLLLFFFKRTERDES